MLTLNLTDVQPTTGERLVFGVTSGGSPSALYTLRDNQATQGKVQFDFTSQAVKVTAFRIRKQEVSFKTIDGASMTGKVTVLLFGNDSTSGDPSFSVGGLDSGSVLGSWGDTEDQDLSDGGDLTGYQYDYTPPKG